MNKQVEGLVVSRRQPDESCLGPHHTTVFSSGGITPLELILAESKGGVCSLSPSQNRASKHPATSTTYATICSSDG